MCASQIQLFSLLNPFLVSLNILAILFYPFGETPFSIAGLQQSSLAALEPASQVFIWNFLSASSWGIPSASNLCWVLYCLDSLLLLFVLFLWSIYPLVAYQERIPGIYIFETLYARKCLYSALQLTILDGPGFLLEIFCTHILSPRFQPQDVRSSSIHYI